MFFAKMKQYITKEQWDELNENQKKELFEFYFGSVVDKWIRNRPANYNIDLNFLCIGLMLKFLGDDWYGNFCKNGEVEMPGNENLCDALWDAVKEKLK